MEYGAHLPVIDMVGRPFSLDLLLQYASAAEELGFQTLCVNDHLVFTRPWLDAPTTMAAVLPRTKRITLATTVVLPIVRGLIPIAKAMAAIDLLSNGRLRVGIGPGSSALDYSVAGIPYEERWKRLDEAVQALRSLWEGNKTPFRGRFYSTEEVELLPLPYQGDVPPIWIGSWGSDAGLRRVAHLGDGWLASAYNTTPKAFEDAWGRLQGYLTSQGRTLEGFPNAVATMFFYITEDRNKAEQIVHRILSPMLKRPEEELRLRLLVGPPDECAAKLVAYKAAGAQRVYLWPVDDELHQLEAFQSKVAPLVQ